MVNESAKRAIEYELRGLRRQPGTLDAAKITSARTILKGLGGDDPEVALARLASLASEFPDDRELMAAMSTMGWGSSHVTAADRLTALSERQFVDPRTVRRWSDEGIKKLSLLIVGAAPWLQPRIRQRLEELNGSIRFSLHIAIPAGLRMGTPGLWLNSEGVELGMEDLDAAPTQQDLRTSSIVIASIADLPVEVRLQWMGEKFPIYETVTHGSRAVFFRSRIVFSELKTTISAST